MALPPLTMQASSTSQLQMTPTLSLAASTSVVNPSGSRKMLATRPPNPIQNAVPSIGIQKLLIVAAARDTEATMSADTPKELMIEGMRAGLSNRIHQTSAATTVTAPARRTSLPAAL